MASGQGINRFERELRCCRTFRWWKAALVSLPWCHDPVQVTHPEPVLRALLQGAEGCRLQPGMCRAPHRGTVAEEDADALPGGHVPQAHAVVRGPRREVLAHRVPPHHLHIRLVPCKRTSTSC